MKKILFFAALFVLVSVSPAFAQTWFYTQPNGQPGGSATYVGPSMQQQQNQYQPRVWNLPLYNANDAKRQQQENRLRELEILRQERELGIER
jgi:hypothetical protein